MQASTSNLVRSVGLVVSCVVLAAVALLSLAVGAKPIPLGTVVDALVHPVRGDADHLIVRTIRAPRTMLGLLVGSALGIAGGVMQGLTRNPLADPGVLGVNAGAALFVAVGMYVLGTVNLSLLVWFAFAGSAMAAVVVHALGSSGRDGANPVRLALAGAAVSILCLSVTRAVLLVDVATLDRFRFWSVGSIAGRPAAVAWTVLPFIVVGALFAFAIAGGLDGLALGEDVARSLGRRVGLVRSLAALSVVLLCGAATAAAGPIAFVGLAVPHVARSLVGPGHRWLLAYSAVLAAALLLGADVVGRVIAPPGEVEAGLVTAMVGSPVFLALVCNRRTVQA